MAVRPGDSIPRHSGDWAATLATYRLLNNDRVTAEAIGQPVFDQTRRLCRDRAVTLCVHDLSELDPVREISDTCLQQHSVLAVDGGPVGEVIGLLHQYWFDDPKAPEGETRSQRRLRWTRSKVWPEAVQQIGPPGNTPGNIPGSIANADRWIHVADREADDFQMFHACLKTSSGWVIRSQHDRHLYNQSDPLTGKALTLRQVMADAPAVGGYTVQVHARPGPRPGQPCPIWQEDSARAERLAKVQVSHRQVTLAPPGNDPRYDQPLTMTAVKVTEVDPPADAQPLDWLLLTSEPVAGLADTMRIIQWYRRRWLIEDFHKAQKTGCRLEKSQLRDPQAVQRLAAISAAVAVRLLQLRDAADDSRRADQPADRHCDPLWVLVVATLAKVPPASLTVRQFHHAIAQRGGWLGRKHDGRPGFQSLWHGWQRIADHVEGILIYTNSKHSSHRGCV